MCKVFLYFLGIIFVSLGLFFTIIYLNLLTMGYSFLEFGKFIIKEPIIWLIFIGTLLIIVTQERRKK